MLRGATLALALLISALVPGTSMAGVKSASDSAPQKPPAASPSLPCSDHETDFPSCGIDAPQRQKAEALFEQAAKLAREEKFDAALDKLQAARAISPRDTAYATAEQAVRAKVANREVRLGDRALQRGDTKAAIAAFRRALQLDPSNGYAQQRLHDASPPPPDAAEMVPENMGEVRLTPAAGIHSFDYRGPCSGAMANFGALFGLSAVADSGLISRPVRLHLDPVDWETGSRILERACKFIVVPLSQRQILVANDTPQNRRELTRMILRVFRPNSGTTKQ
jgi:tetratricopeptide (TPR) repeat protein